VQNLFGLALGPFLSGALSDSIGLESALSIIPAFSLLAAGCFLMASRSYETDKARANDMPVSAVPSAAKFA
jgi:predicted MFS family arabinose efflux permease